MFNVRPTKAQLNQAEKGSPKDVKLNSANIKEIIYSMNVHPTIENILYSYVTGKGRYEDYSRAYLKKYYNISEEIKQYKALEREYRKNLEKAIVDNRQALDQLLEPRLL